MMEPTEVTFLARCPHCGERVAATVLKRREEILPALARGEKVEALHVADRDHIWELTNDDKANLEKALREGLL
jgi:hypothetical protein